MEKQVNNEHTMWDSIYEGCGITNGTQSSVCMREATRIKVHHSGFCAEGGKAGKAGEIS